MGAATEFFVQPLEYVHVQHLALEIGAEQGFTQNGFIELLQFIHGKGLGQQVRLRHFDIEEKPKGLERFAGDLAVVEDHFRQAVHRAPGTFRVEMTRRRAGRGEVDQGVIAYADKALHDPAIGGQVDPERCEDSLAPFATGAAMVAKSTALFEVYGFEAGAFAEDALRGSIEVLFSADIAAGEGKQGLVFYS